MKPGRRTTAGFLLTAAGVLASRLGVRQSQPPPEPQPDSGRERTTSPEEVERARTELSEALARRAASE
ncbi:MAG TPA: hypothetical protein VF032_00755 [Thermoleophilaceae bacterium]